MSHFGRHGSKIIGDVLPVFKGQVRCSDGPTEHLGYHAWELRSTETVCNGAGIPTTTPGVAVQAVDKEEFLIFGMSPTKTKPVFLYEQIIEPALGHGGTPALSYESALSPSL